MVHNNPGPTSGAGSNSGSGSGPSNTSVPLRPGLQARGGTFSASTTTATTTTSSFSSRSGLGTPSRPRKRRNNNTHRSTQQQLQQRRRRRRRLPTEFLLPDGRKVLVALPEEAETLRRKFSKSNDRSDRDDEKQIEVVIHGSAEHRRFLYQTKAHHENRLSELREKLKIHHDEAVGGVHVLDEWEGLRRVIGEISGHISRVGDGGSGSGSGRSSVKGLKTSFSKFGYDAQLRTYGEDEEEDGDDEEEDWWEDGVYGTGTGDAGVGGYDSSMTTTATTLATPTPKSTPTPAGTVTDGGGGGGGGGRNGNGTGNSGGGSGSSSSDGEDGSEEYGGGYSTIKLFQRPVVKQYFHRGLLWRASEETEVMSFELFFDLLYVGIIAINGDHAAEEYDGHELLRFVVTFIMSWMIWSGTTQLISWFETNDVLQRVKILFLIACLLGHTTNMLRAFHEGGHDTYTMLVSFYLAARFLMALSCLAAAILVPLVRGAMIGHILHILIASAFWIASTALPNTPRRLIPIFIAIAIDLFGSMVHVAMFRYGRSSDTKMAQRFARMFEFYPAINIEHKVERTGAFISLVLGYSVVALIFQNTSEMGLNAFLGKAVLGLVQSFVFNWLYFEVDGAGLKMHAIRRHPNSAFLWQHAHLTFAMSYILAAAALSKMVVATDCPDAPLEALTEFYQHKSDGEVHLGLRLYYCVGLGVALFSMGLISFSHEHKVPRGSCRLPKWARLLNRGAVCVVFFCLPAVSAETLDSLKLIALTTCLSIWVLLFEIYARACRTESFFGRRRTRVKGGGGGGEGDDDDDTHRRCYTAVCTKRELEAAMKQAEASEVRMVDDGGENGDKNKKKRTGDGDGDGTRGTGETTVTEVVEVLEGQALGRGEKTAVTDYT